MIVKSAAVITTGDDAVLNVLEYVGRYGELWARMRIFGRQLDGSPVHLLYPELLPIQEQWALKRVVSGWKRPLIAWCYEPERVVVAV